MLRTTPLPRHLSPATARPHSRTVALALVGRTQSAQQQTRQAHAISNPTLANIEKRWEAMPPQEQGELWMALRDRMKENWAERLVLEDAFQTPLSTPRRVRSPRLVPTRSVPGY